MIRHLEDVLQGIVRISNAQKEFNQILVVEILLKTQTSPEYLWLTSSNCSHKPLTFRVLRYVGLEESSSFNSI